MSAASREIPATSASREIPAEFSCASCGFANRYSHSIDSVILGRLVLRWKPCLWRLRHRGPCLRRPPRLERLSCALARFQPAHAQGGASREKASITPRNAEGAQLRDNITSAANNDNWCHSSDWDHNSFVYLTDELLQVLRGVSVLRIWHRTFPDGMGWNW